MYMTKFYVYICRHQKSHTDPTTVRTLRSMVMVEAPDHKVSVSYNSLLVVLQFVFIAYCMKANYIQM